MEKEKKLLSPGETAAMLGVSTNCLRRWENAGLIKCVRTFGKHRRFRIEDVKKLSGEGAKE